MANLDWRMLDSHDIWLEKRKIVSLLVYSVVEPMDHFHMKSMLRERVHNFAVEAPYQFKEL